MRCAMLRRRKGGPMTTQRDRLWGEWLDHSDLSDEDFRAYMASKDREKAYELAWQSIAAVLAIFSLLLACGVLDGLL
jgi:hypothetical protein